MTSVAPAAPSVVVHPPTIFTPPTPRSRMITQVVLTLLAAVGISLLVTSLNGNLPSMGSVTIGAVAFPGDALVATVSFVFSALCIMGVVLLRPNKEVHITTTQTIPQIIVETPAEEDFPTRVSKTAELFRKLRSCHENTQKSIAQLRNIAIKKRAPKTPVKGSPYLPAK